MEFVGRKWTGVIIWNEWMNIGHILLYKMLKFMWLILGQVLYDVCSCVCVRVHIWTLANVNGSYGYAFGKQQIRNFIENASLLHLLGPNHRQMCQTLAGTSHLKQYKYINIWAVCCWMVGPFESVHPIHHLVNGRCKFRIPCVAWEYICIPLIIYGVNRVQSNDHHSVFLIPTYRACTSHISQRPITK